MLDHNNWSLFVVEIVLFGNILNPNSFQFIMCWNFLLNIPETMEAIATS